MKICDITQSYTPTSGGIRRYLHEKQAYIKNNPEHEHVLIIPGESDTILKDANTKVYTIGAKHVPGCEPYRFTFRLDKVNAILQEENPDIIELGSAYVMPHVAFHFKKKKPCSLVGFYHTDFPGAYVEPVVRNMTGQQMAQRARKAAEKYAKAIYNKCDITIASTSVHHELLTNIGIERIAKVHLGVDLDTFHPGHRDEVFRASLGLKENDVLMIYAGRLDIEKRVEMLLQAFHKISDEFPGQLLMVGAGPLQPMVEEYANKDVKIQYRPYQTQKEDLARMLASSDIYVSAGPHETFGLSIIEAQASGLCVLGVAAGALKERVPSHVGLLSEADNMPMMAEQMLALSRNGHKEKGRNARTLVEQLSWSNTFQNLFEIYHNLHQNRLYVN